MSDVSKVKTRRGAIRLLAHAARRVSAQKVEFHQFCRDGFFIRRWGWTDKADETAQQLLYGLSDALKQDRYTGWMSHKRRPR